MAFAHVTTMNSRLWSGLNIKPKRQIRKDQDWGSPQAGLADKEELQSQSVSSRER